MRAALLREIPGKLEIDDVEVGSPGPHEVLIRTVAAGLCHSDLHFMEGKYPYPTPALLGHESAGVVEAVGDQVSYVQPGDHVITCLSVYCGNCEPCLTGHLSLCFGKDATRRAPSDPPRLTHHGAEVYPLLDMGSFAERMLIHEHGLVKIREDMPLDRAALIGCGVTTGVGAVFNTAKVEPGSTVAVIGCGGVGLNCIQGAAIAGAGKVIAVDMLESKLELARQFGATHTVDASQGDPVGAVRDLADGIGVHYSFEAIGMKQTSEQAFGMLRAGGTCTVIGMIPVGQSVEIPGYELLAEKRLMGSNMGSNRFRVDMPRYIDLYLDGRLKLDELVSRRISLDEVNDGFEAMKAGEVARSVIMFD
jgi:S-(hydroxymethyl)glutathione dehydrogenase / alcohol dehydrogenase